MSNNENKISKDVCDKKILELLKILRTLANLVGSFPNMNSKVFLLESQWVQRMLKKTLLRFLEEIH